MFYEAIVKRQFPSKCPPKESLFYYRMTSYGFGGEANKLVKTFNYFLFSSATQVYAQPNYIDNYRKRYWLWASPSCPESIIKYNPWA
jgi:hypothetical protein